MTDGNATSSIAAAWDGFRLPFSAPASVRMPTSTSSSGWSATPRWTCLAHSRRAAISCSTTELFTSTK